MRFPTLVVAGLLALVCLPAQAQSLVEASTAAKAERAAGMGWPVSANLGPAPAPPLTAAERTALQGTFGEVYTTGKNLDAAATTGAIAQVRERLIAFKAALATVADQPNPTPASGPVLAQYQGVATRFAEGIRSWSIAIQLNMPTILAANEFKTASEALAAANTVYLGKDAK